MNSFKNHIGLVDYGAGNITSITNILKYINAKIDIVEKSSEIKFFHKIILPGVGSFGNAADFLKQRNYFEELDKFKKSKKLILGICLGMQLFCKSSEESNKNHLGLGWFNTKVKRFKNLPAQIGWQEVITNFNSFNFEKDKKKDYYFLNSYYVPIIKKYTLCKSKYINTNFSSVIKKNNIIGVQFHPERSQENGLNFLKKFNEI
jgi:glutamine amidotransferase